MQLPNSIKALLIILLAAAFWQPNAEAQARIFGSQPWCMTDGSSYDCYYYTPSACEAILPQYGGNRWCERNPEVYRLDRRDLHFGDRDRIEFRWDTPRRSWQPD